MRRFLGIITIALYIVVLLAASFSVQYYFIVIKGINFEDNKLLIGLWTNTVYYGSLFILYVVLFLHMWKTQFKQFKTLFVRNVMFIGIGFGAILFTSFAATQLLTLLGVTDTSENQQIWEDLMALGASAQVMIALTTVLFAPVVEEVLFRLSGFWLLKKVSFIGEKAFPYVAVIVTSLVFGLIHVTAGDFIQIIYYAGLGGVLGFIYYKTKNIYVPIVVHMVWNGISFLVTMLTL